ncbi:hypothetical protein [Legionella sp. 227]|uniref:hypothetical protein n=1 Tax=Legionella sp. 227 TaxID=3367288 RepID=UPI00370DE1DB
MREHDVNETGLSSGCKASQAPSSHKRRQIAVQYMERKQGTQELSRNNKEFYFIASKLIK